MRHKKGALLYAPILLVFMVFGLIYAWSEITARYEKFDKKIGERQFDILNTYHLGERYLFYIDQSAKYSAYQGVYDLAKRGGCRFGDIHDGYNLWGIDSPTIGLCFPSADDSKNGFFNFFSDNLNNYLSSYEDTSAISDISKAYSLTFEGNNINGTAKLYLLLSLPVVSTESPGKYTLNPSFWVNLENYDFTDYDELKERAQKAIDRCEKADPQRAPLKCVIEPESKELFNVDTDANPPDTRNLALDTCPDGREAVERIEDDYIWNSNVRSSVYGFCVKSENPLVYAYEEGDPNAENSETLGLKNINYRFALPFEDVKCTEENNPDLDNTDCETYPCSGYYSCQDVKPLCYCDRDNIPDKPHNSCQGDCLSYCSVVGQKYTPGYELVEDTNKLVEDDDDTTRCNQFSCDNYGTYVINTNEYLECSVVDPTDTCACPADDTSLGNACKGEGCDSLDCEKDVEYEVAYGINTRCLERPCGIYGDCNPAPCACNTKPLHSGDPSDPLDPFNPSNRLNACQGLCYCNPPQGWEDTGDCDDARSDGIDCHWSEVPQKWEYDPSTCEITTYRCDKRDESECPCVPDPGTECAALEPDFGTKPGCGKFDGCNVYCGDCAPKPVPPPPTTPPPQQPTPSLNSCEDRCGDYDPEASCQCDSVCSAPQFNDCCPDISQFCDQPSEN